jgi:hypothetical protein
VRRAGYFKENGPDVNEPEMHARFSILAAPRGHSSCRAALEPATGILHHPDIFVQPTWGLS